MLFMTRRVLCNTSQISSLLPSNKQRSMVVYALVSAMSLMSPEFSNTRRIQVVNPRRATYKDLAIYHSRDYLDFVLDPKNSMRGLSANSDEANNFGLEDVRRDFFCIPTQLHHAGRIVLYFRVYTITCH